jgi:hypothetical protein
MNQTLPQPWEPSRFPSRENQKVLLRLCEKSKDDLEERDRWRWHAYDYGWRRVFLFDRNPRSPIDPDGDWYNEEFADQVERMFLLERCGKQWGSCAARWREMGAVCCETCKPYVPEYWKLSDAEFHTRTQAYELSKMSPKEREDRQRVDEVSDLMRRHGYDKKIAWDHWLDGERA